MSEVITEFGSKRALDEVVKAIISGQLAKSVAVACKCIQPLQRVEIRKSEILKQGYIPPAPEKDEEEEVEPEPEAKEEAPEDKAETEEKKVEETVAEAADEGEEIQEETPSEDEPEAETEEAPEDSE